LFTFSLDERAKQWYTHNVGKGKRRVGWTKGQVLSCALPYFSHCFPTERDPRLSSGREGNYRCSLGQVFTVYPCRPRLVYPRPCVATTLLVRS
jgi:hypothetical protein